ncbi:MAG: DUF11 domain-containing protein [Candidatus Binatia bacterium]
MGVVRALVVAVAVVVVATGPAAALTPVVSQGAGSGQGGATAALADFRTRLGVLNPPTGSPGRREIPWDTLSDTVSAPALLPGDYFFTASRRGLLFTTAGTGFQVSADGVDPDNTPLRFGNVNASYTGTFTAFSRERLFSPLGSNVMDVDIFVAPANAAGVTRGFGAMFVDVDTAGAASLEFFNGTTSLGSFPVPPAPEASGLSFLGVDFVAGVVTRVRITTGTAALGPDDVSIGGPADVVVLDDIVWAQPFERADLRVAVTATPDPVEVGAELTHRIDVTNDGPGTATSIAIVDSLPAGATFVAGTDGCTASGSAVGCTVGTLAAGATTAVSIVVTPHRGGPFEAAVELTSDNDPDLSNNTARVSVTVPGCTIEATYPALSCRLDELFGRVQDAMTATALRSRLLGQLARAKGRVETAEGLAAAGQKGSARRLLKAARGTAAGVARQLKGGRSGLDGALRAELAGVARGIATDLKTLARS